MKSKPKESNTNKSKGNYISEWFGRRVWKDITPYLENNDFKNSCNCPFLTDAIGRPTECIKKTANRARPTGVCTINSDANANPSSDIEGERQLRQDWLACPYRTLDSRFTLIREAIQRLFEIKQDETFYIFSGEKIKSDVTHNFIIQALKVEKKRVFIFLADKLGGEVDIPSSEFSPGTKVDVSIIEVTDTNLAGVPTTYGKHVLFEIQTADFHGSPLHAISELEKTLEKSTSAKAFHDDLNTHKDKICGVKVEGPNKSNIFKRTFYQAVLKIMLASDKDCAGFVLVIPIAVWKSWEKHLGVKHLTENTDGTSTLKEESPSSALNMSSKRNAWIFIFDIDSESPLSPQPIKILKRISVTAEALAEHAFKHAAQAAIASNAIGKYREALQNRIKLAMNLALTTVDKAKQSTKNKRPINP